MNDTFNLDQSIERIQNKIKRTPRLIYVYFVKGKFAATTSPDEGLMNRLIGVYDSRQKTYTDSFLDQDVRWAIKRM